MRTTLAILAIPALLVAGQARAQQSPDSIVTLKLPRSMVQSIGNALMEAPYKTSAPILTELQRQLVESDHAATAQPSPTGTAAAQPTPVAPPAKHDAPPEKDPVKKP